jgi:outer membrane protein OmpA-like peptidoglycan-associated protein
VAPPPPPPPPPPAPSGAPILVAFPPGSSALPVESLASLKLLSRQRGAATITVTGYGDATSTDAAAQASAVPLALARARAVAGNLLSSGVPSSSIHINAEAQGRGAAARLTN